MEEKNIAKLSVIWRGKQLNVDVDPSCTVKEFGELLQELTNIKPETLKLIVPQSTNKSSKLIAPFSDACSSLVLKDAAISHGKVIRMMGVFDDEIEEVSENGKRPDLRIIGFDEEEQRLKQRVSGRPQFSLKLPQGPYIFCDFRTLHLPGIELNPPSSEALKRMHMLACDPGIIAIMNKHRWRVGIMTEMAPLGYVGVSPKCILGFNKNMGEEISLRLRTDDLKGFRKYGSIKKTLLHELAHMVHSEHDANFFALNKQLNEEAASLDWTKSRSHVLSGRNIFDTYGDEFSLEPSTNIVGRKLGGESSSLASARALSGAAAYRRFLNSSTNELEGSQNKVKPSREEEIVPGTEVEPDPDDAGHLLVQGKVDIEHDSMNVDIVTGNLRTSGSRISKEHNSIGRLEPDPDDACEDKFVSCLEPDPDDSGFIDPIVTRVEPDRDDSSARDAIMTHDEPDPDDHLVGGNAESCTMDVVQKIAEPHSDDSSNIKILRNVRGIPEKLFGEPDPDDSSGEVLLDYGNKTDMEMQQSRDITVLKTEPDPDDHAEYLNSNELQRIEEPVAALCARLQKAIETLRSQVTPAEATSVLQTLSKIVRNVIEHPSDTKYRRLRKANPQFQRNVANYKAAVEVLEMVGFHEDVISDDNGQAETYLVLKRNDPGLLWLAKSSLEVSMA